MPSATELIAANLAQVRGRIAAAAARAGRSADEVQLVAVTKYVGREEIEALLAAGCRDLGESRPQDLWDKAAALDGRDLRWHLIGHLQRNKVRRTLPYVHLLHSVDSRRLLDELDREAARRGQPPDLLLEVNVSREATKTGLAEAEAENLLASWSFPHLRLRGLMGMATQGSTPDEARREFAHLRSLHAKWRPAAPRPEDFRELSMGMSGDFEAAILEGATIVRVGSALFEGLTP